MLRCRKQPTPNNIFDRSALSPSKFSAVDAALKDLKLLSRRLHKALSLQQTESQVLERLYYKSKNQHHSALFWRRVCEMRRFAKRLLEFDVAGVVDGLRATFFRDADPSNSKSMSSSWSRYADEKYISSVISSLVSFSSLLQKMHERLGETYKSFSLAMQTGAFIQLTLTLTAIASRIAILVSEIDDTVQRTREVLTRLSAVLMKGDPDLEPVNPSPTEENKPEEPPVSKASGANPASAVVPIVIERKQIPQKTRLEKGSTTSTKKKKKKGDEIDAIFGF